jgi:glyoxylase-like metal-dependent hydrolase (beta-lactamase superfamily II)
MLRSFTLVVSVVVGLGCAPRVTLQPLAPDVWLHVTTRNGIPANGLVVVGKSASILVDSGWSDADAAQLFAFAARRHRPVAAVVVTHSHDDRIGGAGLAQRRDVPVYALARTIEHARTPDPPAVNPSRPGEPPAAHGVGASARAAVLAARPVRDGDSVELGGAAVTLAFVGPGHSDDNLAVWVPSARVLFGGCLVKSARSTDLGNIADANLAAWPRAIATLRARFPDASIVVPGHGPVGGDALGRTLELLTARGEGPP